GCVAVCDCLGVGVDLFQQAVAVGEGVDPSGLGYGQGVGVDDDIAPVVVGEGVGPVPVGGDVRLRSEGHTSELQSRDNLVFLLLPAPTALLVPCATLFRSLVALLYAIASALVSISSSRPLPSVKV